MRRLTLVPALSDLPRTERHLQVTAGSCLTIGAVRIGDVVHKHASPWTPTVDALVRYLEDAGADGVPRALGFDEQYGPFDAAVCTCRVTGRAGRDRWAGPRPPAIRRTSSSPCGAVPIAEALASAPRPDGSDPDALQEPPTVMASSPNVAGTRRPA